MVEVSLLTRSLANLRILLLAAVFLVITHACTADSNQFQTSVVDTTFDVHPLSVASTSAQTPTATPISTQIVHPTTPVTTPVTAVATPESDVLVQSPSTVANPSEGSFSESGENNDDADEKDDGSDFDFGSLFDPGTFPQPPFGFPDLPPFGMTDGGTDDPVGYIPYELPADLTAVLSGDDWSTTSSLSPDFITGHVAMDYVSTAYLNKYLDSTIEAMNDTGSGWIFYDQYATYYSVSPPEIDLIESEWNFGFRSLTAEEITQFTTKAHESGSKFGLLLELNYDGLLSDRANPFSDTSMGQAGSAEQYISLQADLAATDDPTAIEFWEKWFDEYEKFVISHALLAEAIGIDMLVIGKQLGAPTRTINTNRWRDLIARVRGAYSGPVSYAVWVDENQGPHFDFPFDAVDYAIIYDWGKLSDETTPSVAELESIIRQKNEAIYWQLNLDTGIPVISPAPFQSRKNDSYI